MNRQPLSLALALAVILLGTSAGLAWAQTAGLIGPDTARRTVQVMIGLVLAGYANLMPKEVGRWPASLAAGARSQSALRVGGWSLTLAGISYAALWAFAPMTVANIASGPIVATALLITMAQFAWTLRACRAKQAGPSELN